MNFNIHRTKIVILNCLLAYLTRILFKRTVLPQIPLEWNGCEMAGYSCGV